MAEPKIIYLQPLDQVDPQTGRLWSKDDAPEGGPAWIRYELAKVQRNTETTDN